MEVDETGLGSRPIVDFALAVMSLLHDLWIRLYLSARAHNTVRSIAGI